MVRFRWEDEPADTYFELAIHRLELTRDVALTVTDFAEDGDTEDAIRLWNSQIDDLRRIAGMWLFIIFQKFNLLIIKTIGIKKRIFCKEIAFFVCGFK